jgi:hypothetical protein
VTLPRNVVNKQTDFAKKKRNIYNFACQLGHAVWTYISRIRMHAKSMPAYRLYTHGPTYHCNNIYYIMCIYDDLSAGATGQPLLHTTSYPSQSTEHDASYFLTYTVSLNMHVSMLSRYNNNNQSHF